ncbi:hypothetical protein SAMN05444416_10513 [Thermoactinomyces sp. DSM 45892]|nr:hypothetical protein SAMN05444416_10513 [Thermoactinomyces sp. DSM 45892]
MRKYGVSFMFVLFLAGILSANLVVKIDAPYPVQYSSEPVGG